MRNSAMRLCAGAVGVLLLAAPTAVHASDGYVVEVTSSTPDVKYFGSFSYDRAVVTGPNDEMARVLTKRVRAFTMPWVDQYRDPDAKTVKYLKKAQPAYFGTTVDPTPKCLSGYVCLSQRYSFSTPLIAGSMTGIHARAWSTQTGKTAQLKDFVSAGDLPKFTDRVKTAIRKADCYGGFDIDLPANYESFPNWVPIKSGIAVWFPEYQFGCKIMSLKVSWP